MGASLREGDSWESAESVSGREQRVKVKRLEHGTAPPTGSQGLPRSTPNMGEIEYEARFTPGPARVIFKRARDLAGESMKERPILFSAPMVRAIRDGSKTQTRLIVKANLLPIVEASLKANGRVCLNMLDTDLVSPYGVVGDRLWVREAFFEEVDPLTSKPYSPPRACYRATENGEVFCDDGDGHAEENKNGTFKSPWKPSIHMPRWASRILLEITEVRIQRLQDINEGDAEAEGVERCNSGWGWERYAAGKGYLGYHLGTESCAVDSFRSLWESVYGPGSWDANPYVWALSFKKVAA